MAVLIGKRLRRRNCDIFHSASVLWTLWTMFLMFLAKQIYNLALDVRVTGARVSGGSNQHKSEQVCVAWPQKRK